MKVLVLGCGPAGLMAAHAVANATGGQAHIDIASRKRKSTMYGAQYLHRPIPGATDHLDWVMVDYYLRGTIDDYRSKVYGQTYDGSVSPEDLLERHRAWNIAKTYDVLWDMYEARITDMDIKPHDINDARTEGDGYKYILNTIPLDKLCPKGHAFRYRTIKAAGSAPDRGIEIPYQCEPNTVVCNGNPEPSWYRLSNIFGMKTVEWPEIVKPPLSHATIVKPVDTNCNCWPFMTRLGRYGTWTKGVLSHQAYFDTFDMLAGVKRQ